MRLMYCYRSQADVQKEFAANASTYTLLRFFKEKDAACIQQVEGAGRGGQRWHLACAEGSAPAHVRHY